MENEKTKRAEDLEKEFERVMDKTITMLFKDGNPMHTIQGIMSQIALHSLLALDDDLPQSNHELQTLMENRLREIISKPAIMLQLVLSAKIGSMALIKEIEARGGMDSLLNIPAGAVDSAKADPDFSKFVSDVFSSMEALRHQADAKLKKPQDSEPDGSMQSWIHNFMGKHKRS